MRPDSGKEWGGWDVSRWEVGQHPRVADLVRHQRGAAVCSAQAVQGGDEGGDEGGVPDTVRGDDQIHVRFRVPFGAPVPVQGLRGKRGDAERWKGSWTVGVLFIYVS